jgi:type III restriction enzyme
MKLKFKTQDFQTDAVNVVADLFIGQNKTSTTFSIVEEQQVNLLQNEFGVGNAMLIDDAALLENMNAIQRRNKLPLTSLDSAGGELGGALRSFCVEMETGTGKTVGGSAIRHCL